MDIRKKTVLVLGGAGLVGYAICRKLVEEETETLIVASLMKSEADECIERLRQSFPESACTYVAQWGDIFAPLHLKDVSRAERLTDAAMRATITDSIFTPLSDAIVQASTLYQWCATHTPHIIVDCVNAATGLAYADVYRTANHFRSVVTGEIEDTTHDMTALTEQLLLTMPIPQLIRHIQILWQSMCTTKVGCYLKIGTSGTGGMGVDVPYTHSERKATQLLLFKAAIAGAHTLLLFLLARTSGGPIVKELKPAAFIGWKRIGHGPIQYRGKPFYLEDCAVDQASSVAQAAMTPDQDWPANYLTDNDGNPRPLEAPYIDTGENGMWALSEFSLVTEQTQMQFITPEEIGQIALWEINGRNTGHEIVAALDNSTLGPTYRAGYMRQNALEQLNMLQDKYGVKSISFEMGGPFTAKLLFEAHILRAVYRTYERAVQATPAQMGTATLALINDGAQLRQSILSVGIPILLPDGQRFLRGHHLKVPSAHERTRDTTVRDEQIDQWANEGWIDLRAANWERWHQRMHNLLTEIGTIDSSDTSSFLTKGHQYWGSAEAEGHPIHISKLVSWIYRSEDLGIRMKD